MVKSPQNAGFSLVELMIVVSIIALLAAIAIPHFIEFAFKSKMSEATRNLATIKTAQFAYAAENDIFMECGPSPPAPAGTDGFSHLWVETPNSSGENGFELIGFEPNGAVRYQYEVPIATAERFVITAQADLDNNGVPCKFTLDNQAAGHAKPTRTPVTEF